MRLRLTLLGVIAAVIVLALLAIVRYPPFFSMPGAAGTLILPSVLLVLYALVITWATSGYNPARLVMLPAGTLIGFVVAALESAHIAQENFSDLGGTTATATTAIAMVGMIALFALAGSRAAWRRASLATCAASGIWSGMIGLLIAVAFGVTILNLAPETLQARNVGSPDLARSGWTDLRAFTIADVFDSAVKVLIVGPILGAIFGTIGGIIEYILFRRPEPTE